MPRKSVCIDNLAWESTPQVATDKAEGLGKQFSGESCRPEAYGTFGTGSEETGIIVEPSSPSEPVSLATLIKARRGFLSRMAAIFGKGSNCR